MDIELKPCPFCGNKLIHVAGKRVNRFYNGERTHYYHYNPKCFLHGVTITDATLDKWNRRKN